MSARGGEEGAEHQRGARPPTDPSAGDRVRGEPAAVREYTVTARQLPWHVRSLGFDTGGTSYRLTTWYHPDIGDRAALPVRRKAEKGFTPL
ncbi:hypothetical protein [Streptomyces heilongjiangensis]|uniref:Uncharacterized protein n=1 Tax=Streptomyces heilongjiangensis TaxID=945052 RepID=A0ABW1B639_9ACTN|nr:hypothetical protein [Streptomyces heilongjiangensis]MDC2949177.1 hypothetical protein [Streptomyces heilongjiangensis]